MISLGGIGLEIVEYDHVAAVASYDVEEMPDMLSEARRFIILQLACVEARARDLPARAAFVVQAPGLLKVLDGLVALVKQALVIGRKLLQRIANRDDELRVGPQA